MEYLKECKKIGIKDTHINMLKYNEIDEQDNLIEMREEYTYGTDITVKNIDKIKNMISDCQKLIDDARNIVLT